MYILLVTDDPNFLGIPGMRFMKMVKIAPEMLIIQIVSISEGAEKLSALKTCADPSKWSTSETASPAPMGGTLTSAGPGELHRICHVTFGACFQSR